MGGRALRDSTMDTAIGTADVFPVEVDKLGRQNSIVDGGLLMQ